MKDQYARYAADPMNNQGKEYGGSDIENGWSKNTIPLGDSFGKNWEGAFGAIAGATQAQPTADLTKIELRQDKEFINGAGNVVPAPGDRMAQAFYTCAYSIKASLIIAGNTASPTYKLLDDNPGITAAEAQTRIPPLNKLSDSLWTIWKDLNGNNIQNARKLRYIGRSTIANPDTRYIMRGIFFKAKRHKLVPWPGLRYTLHDEEGQALLATPNGLATAWLLIDHNSILGARDLAVTIWTYNEVPIDPNSDQSEDEEDEAIKIDYFMLWDMGDPDKVPDFSQTPDLGGGTGGV
ncbi:MAG: hypothetical protein Q9201_000408 [Fulgogasparrea decipioides]